MSAGGGLRIPADLDATLVLLRHGESQLIVEGRFQGQAETPLSGLGERQADLAAGRLARPQDPPRLPVPGGPPLEIVHSPLLRTTQTAEAVGTLMAGAAGFGAPVPLRADPGFLEIAQGDWEGRPVAEIAERWPEILSTWRRAPLEAWAPGGERLVDVAERARLALARVIDGLAAAAEGVRAGPRDLPPAGYGGPGPETRPWSVLVAHDGLFKIVLLSLFDLPLERFWMWRFDLCGISVVDLVGGRAVLRTHGRVEHLAPLHDEELAAEARAEARRRSGAL